MSSSAFNQIAIVMAVAWCAGLLLVLVLRCVSGLRDKTSEMLAMVLGQGLVVAILIGSLVAGKLVAAVALSIAGARLAYESAAVNFASGGDLRADGRKWAFAAAASCLVLVLLAVAVNWLIAVSMLIGLLLVSMGVGFLSDSFIRTALVRTLIFPVSAVVFLALILREPKHFWMLLVAYLLVEVFDSFALLGGRLWGRTLLVPKLSPKKTVEGLATGLVAVILAAILLNMFVLGLDWGSWIVASIAIVPAALFGDLFASSFKRKAGVKDYPVVLKSQGGLLDILDSWLIAAPVFCLVLIASGV